MAGQEDPGVPSSCERLDDVEVHACLDPSCPEEGDPGVWEVLVDPFGLGVGKDQAFHLAPLEACCVAFVVEAWTEGSLVLEGALDHPVLERGALALTAQQGEAFPALVAVPFVQSSVAMDKNIIS